MTPSSVKKADKRERRGAGRGLIIPWRIIASLRANAVSSETGAEGAVSILRREWGYLPLIYVCGAGTLKKGGSMRGRWVGLGDNLRRQWASNGDRSDVPATAARGRGVGLRARKERR